MRKLGRLFNVVIILVWVLIFYLQFERPFIARFAQNISPTLLISSLLYAIFWLSWFSLPILLLAIIKGRFFCWKICPIGLLQDLIPSFGKTKGTKTNLYIFLVLFITSLFGLNLLAIFDPLVIFNRTVTLFFVYLTIIILLMSIYKKRFWCFKLCPLGALTDWISVIKNRKKFDINKRKTLVSIASGLVFVLLFKIKNLYSKPLNERLLRPPGALPEDEFINRCIRCGSCISVCLTGVLTPTIFESGISGIFTPRLITQIAECDEYCNKCCQACPTLAIRNLPLGVKRNFKIGTARIDRSRCIAWEYNGLCLVCKEYCSYLAIEVVNNQNGIHSPKVIPEFCRGCGHCEKNCPARPIRAIRVYNTRAGEIIPQRSIL